MALRLGKGYCSARSANLKQSFVSKTTSDVNEKIFIEIMYQYPSSLQKFIGLANKTRVEDICKQLIYAQTQAFNNYGFLHMDLHLGNVLCNKSLEKGKEKKIKYIFPQKASLSRLNLNSDQEIFMDMTKKYMK